MRASLVFILAAAAMATEPRGKPSDYPAHAVAGSVTVAAEFTVRSFGVRGHTFVAEDYLTVEVALYPKAGAALQVDAGRFTLRINGRRQALLPQAPGMVAASLKYPDWRRRPTAEVSARVDESVVIVGRPQQVERFPGDRRPTQNRLPDPPRAPRPEDRSGLDPREPVTAAEIAVEAALPEGPARGPVAGYLYFASKDKPARIKSLELLYEGVVLKLR